MNKHTKGIILAGGSGTRLYPLTAVASKQLQVIYDKPMIYYPIATLMLSGIREILIITTPHDIDSFRKLLGNGKQWGIDINYAIQPEPKGIAQAFIIGEEFIGNSQVCLILGDNLFYGKLDFLRNAILNNIGGTVFGYAVTNPSDYGVVEFGANRKVISIEEKPINPKSKYAIPGVYVFNNKAAEIAKTIHPGKRGELEITDMQKAYLDAGELNVEIIGRGIAWLDTGTPESLLEASTFIHAIEKRQGNKIACLEEIALFNSYLNIDEFKASIDTLPNSSYKDYCIKIMKEYADEI